MCTAIKYQNKQCLFGRTLDVPFSYPEEVVIIPRSKVLYYRHLKSQFHHYAMLGIGLYRNDFPLYFDAINEKGLGIAGLNFPDEAYYEPKVEEALNLCVFEFIPYLLGCCGSVEEVKQVLTQVHLCDEAFSSTYATTPLHWMIVDTKQCIVVESTKEGFHVIDNPVGVLTNSPSFDYHMHHLQQYLNVGHRPMSSKWGSYQFNPYSYGMNAIGLPGDFSSASRFIRMCFLKEHVISEHDVDTFFHLMYQVMVLKGWVYIDEQNVQSTKYISGYDLEEGILYYQSDHHHKRQMNLRDYVNKDNVWLEKLREV